MSFQCVELTPMEYKLYRNLPWMKHLHEIDERKLGCRTLHSGDQLSDQEAIGIMKEPMAIVDFSSPLLEMLK